MLISRRADPLFFLSLVFGLESRQLISRRGINRPFGFEQFASAVPVNMGPLRVAFDSLEASGWLSQAAGRSGDGRYFFGARAADAANLPKGTDELFAWLAKEREPGEQDGARLRHWLELSALDWNLQCPLLIQGLDTLLARALSRWLATSGGLDLTTSQMTSHEIGHDRIHPDIARRVTDFLREKPWIRREATQSEPPLMGETDLADDANDAGYAKLPWMLESALFGTGEQSAAALRWLEQTGAQPRWTAERTALEPLLDALFDKPPLATQPDWIVAFGRHGGAVLDDMWPWLCRHTARARVLAHQPLRRLVLDDDGWGDGWGDSAALRQRLKQAGVGEDARVLWFGIAQRNFQPSSPAFVPPVRPAPERYYLRHDGTAKEGASVLGMLHAWFSELAALVGNDPVILGERHWHSGAALAERFTGHERVEASHYLMALAGAGLFADPGLLHQPRSEATIGCYRAREYRVRLATMADLPALLALEEACWPEGSRVSEAVLRHRVSQWPAGQLVLELSGEGGEVAGVVYSQRLTAIDRLFGVDFSIVDQLHHPDGRIVQIQSLNILPAHQSSGYGDQLLEFMLQYCTLHEGIDTVVGVTRCKDYPRHRPMPLSTYIHCRNAHGMPLDPVLRFHELHGARIERLVEGYRPADHDNAGYGVLVHYDLANRQRQELTQPETPARSPTVSVDDAVREAINRCLGQPDGSPLPPQRSLMELGLDSADLLTLGEQLKLRFGFALEPAFFFRYHSLEKMVEALEERLKKRLSASDDTPSPPADGPAKAVTPRLAPTPLSSPAADDGDFAVVGISGHFPGGELDGFWAATRSGASQIRQAPASRAHEAAGTAPVGGYIDDIDCFDHRFFGFTAAEAALMDPQQRLLLEHAWLTLEDAAIAPAQLAGTHTGVFIAAAAGEYREIVELPEQSPFLLTSSSPCMYANRISYAFDLRGPSEYCNTACSSGLVALHRAMQAIKAGECRQALVGAVNLLLSPVETAGYRQMGFLSELGQTRSFQPNADGYVRSEGVGVLLLKPLGDAERNEDRIYLKIKGSGVYHGGKGASLIAPHQDGMKAAMVAAYRSAGVEPDTVCYVEAHGVGSPVADAIEVAAIQAARTELSNGSQRGAPWTISTLKPVIGHCELASGMAALFKVIDAMAERWLPGIPGYEPSPGSIAIDSQHLRLAAGNRPWPALRDASGAELPRRASIGSYGFGGVSAHVVVEEHTARGRAARPTSERPSGAELILLSAREVPSLRAQAARLRRYLAERPALHLADIAYTLQVGRAAMACRWACVTDSIASLLQQLDTLDQPATGRIAVLDGNAIPADTPPAGLRADTAKALANRDWQALADDWLRGIELDWQALPRRDAVETVPRRIRLPGYVFAKTRHWLAPKRRSAPSSAPAGVAQGGDFRQILAERLGCDPAALAGCETRSLASLGLNSLAAVGLKATLEQHLRLPVTLAQLSPWLSLGEVEHSVAALAAQPACAEREPGAAIPVLQAAPGERHAPFALNDIQQSFLSGRKLLAQAERVGCHIYLEFDWRDLDASRLNAAWNRLVSRHDALRIRLLADGRQQISEPEPYRFPIRDLRQADCASRAQALAAVRAAMSHAVYLPGPSPLFDIRVSRLDRQCSRVHLSIDELIVDATSLELLLQQWLMLYRNPAAALPDGGLSFRDYVLSIDAFRQSPRYQRDLTYWAGRLTRMPPGLSLPKGPRPASRERRRLTAMLTPERWQRLKQQGDVLQVSGTALLLTLFGRVLRLANEGNAFSLISTFYGRPPMHPTVDRLIGPLISTHFFAFDGTGGGTLAQQLQQTQRQWVEDIEHMSVSGVAALREARRRHGRQLGLRAPEVVFTSMLNNPVIGRADSFGDAQHDCVTQTPQIHLDHQLREVGGALRFSWDVAIDCHPGGGIDPLFSRYCHLLCELADSHADWQSISETDLDEIIRHRNHFPNDAVLEQGLTLVSGEPPKTPFALTDQQQAYAFSRVVHREEGSSHLYLAIAMQDVEIERLEAAWQKLVAHHPMLRTRILPDGTQQLMETVPALRIERGEHGASPAALAGDMLGRAAGLGDWPYVALRVSPLDGRRGTLHLSTDLLIVDLPSRDLLVRQLLDLYHGRPLKPLSISFGSYIEALEQCPRSAAKERAGRYWRDKFRQLPQGLWSSGGASPGSQYFDYEYRLDRWGELRSRATRAGITADALLISAYAWSLAKHGNRQPFTLVAPGWQRPAVHPQIDALAGDFTTLSWIDFNDAPMTFKARAQRCGRIFAADHREGLSLGLPALRRVSTDKTQPRKLRFPVVFTCLNPQAPLDLPAGASLVKSASRTHGIALDNLSMEQGDSLLLHWDLTAGYVAPAQVEAMFADYCQRLEALAIDDSAWEEQEPWLAG